tara:strand:- start:648 stop:1652 length:1005 start_codon:yes stop_codon:yes gene_type:complete
VPTELNVNVVGLPPAMGSTLEESKARAEAMPDTKPKGKADMLKSGGNMIKKGMKGAGISMGVSSLLKQSQIFTGFLGSVFQIVGGLVDVLLAPLMPILIPFLQFAAKLIPIVAKVAQFWIGDVIVGSIIGLVNWGIMIYKWGRSVWDSLWEIAMGPVDAVKNLWKSFGEAWGFVKQGRWGDALKTVGNALWKYFLSTLKATFNLIKLLHPVMILHRWLTKFEWYNKLIEGLKNFLAPVIDLGRNVMDWAIGFYNDKVRGWIQPILDGLFSALNKIPMFNIGAAPQLGAMAISSDPRPSEINVTVGNTTGQELEMNIQGAQTAVTAVDLQLSNIT